jgi:hypothetical protein
MVVGCKGTSACALHRLVCLFEAPQRAKKARTSHVATSAASGQGATRGIKLQGEIGLPEPLVTTGESDPAAFVLRREAQHRAVSASGIGKTVVR